MLELHSQQLHRNQTMIYLIASIVCVVWIMLISFVLATREVDTLTLLILLTAAGFQLLCLFSILFVGSRSILFTMRMWCSCQFLLLALIIFNYIFGDQQYLMFEGIPPVALLGNHLLILLSFVLLDAKWALRLTLVNCVFLATAFTLHLWISIQDYQTAYGVMWPAFFIYISNPLMIIILAAYHRIRDATAMAYEQAIGHANQLKRIAELEAARDPVSHLPNRIGILSDFQHLLETQQLFAVVTVELRGLHLLRKSLSTVEYYALAKDIGLWISKVSAQLGIRAGVPESGVVIAWWTNSEGLPPYAVAQELMQEFSKQDFANRSDVQLRVRAAALSISDLEIKAPDVILEELKFRMFLAESQGLPIIAADASQ